MAQIDASRRITKQVVQLTEEMHEATLKLLEAEHGQDDPRVITSRNNLAQAYGAAGRTGIPTR